MRMKEVNCQHLWEIAELKPSCCKCQRMHSQPVIRTILCNVLSLLAKLIMYYLSFPSAKCVHTATALLCVPPGLQTKPRPMESCATGLACLCWGLQQEALKIGMKEEPFAILVITAPLTSRVQEEICQNSSLWWLSVSYLVKVYVVQKQVM